ncbi:uncharacterized protein LOC123559935 [Mercenaria mercenaria]|uniref:uncharacterized protein LOC123559935 n=1 Tax=Mercenaria mercenaria TaxID=6596 RepID=UPI00234EE475|nr:uncharacterized protein LOC123559935 [Mercenaria mercenaria]
MATAQQLLKEASGTTEVGFSAKTEAFLQAAGKSHLGHEEAKLFFRFIQQCLHTFMTKLKNLKDVGQVKEILKTSIVCGQAYTHLQHCVEEDKTHTVPSILFYIVRSLQDSVHVYAKYIITVSEMVYEMLDAAGCPKTSHTILGAFHSFLWNTSAKALEKGSSQGLKDVLMFRKMSLLFVCCVPLNNNKNLPLFQYTISHYTQFKREWIDKGTIDTFYSIFQCVFDRLKRLQNTLETDEDKSACRLFLLQIHVLLVEYLLKISDYSKARDIIEVMNEKCPLIISVKDVYSYTADCLEAFKNSQKPNISSVKLRETNNFIKQCIESEPRETLKPLIAALACFTQSFSSKVLVSLETSLVKELSVSCKLVQTMCQKLPLESPKSGKTSDNKKEKELATEKVNCVSACLQSYFKQLQLLHKLLDDDTGLEVFQECTDVSEKFQQYIEANHSQIPENTLSSHRYNIGYICNLIGVLCMHAGHYDMAASLYTVVVNQLHKCQQPQPQLIKMFEKLVDCYIEQEKWTEATQAVVKAFTAVEGDILPVAIIWTRLKKDASSKDEIFQSLTLKTVIESSGVELKGVTCRKLLIVEYEAWKLYSRRRYDTEYHIFCELLETTQTPAQKAEAMVALATTMCITGGTYKNMSAGEMLNKAIIALDKNGTSSERILALANYTKYALLHEEAIEFMKNENGELLYFGTGDLSANSRFTLQQEQDNLPFLVRAIELWEKSLAHKSQKSSKGGEKVSKETTISKENLFGLEHHIDNLIMCGTRLIAMKQPQLALRALQVVKDQLPNLKDSKRALDLSLQVTRSLMLLGRYKEAESVIDGTGDNKKQTRPTSMSLLMSELYMFIGKRDKGLEILQSVLDSKEFLGKTQKIYLMQGTAKRLLSMALCLPGGDHMINSTNQYLLYLAFEAVQCHVTVVNFLTQNKSFEKNSDKWLILNEILSSLLHLCQLCRFIGLPREALCYLKAGLNISQGQGLPRW